MKAARFRDASVVGTRIVVFAIGRFPRTARALFAALVGRTEVPVIAGSAFVDGGLFAYARFGVAGFYTAGAVVEWIAPDKGFRIDLAGLVGTDQGSVARVVVFVLGTIQGFQAFAGVSCAHTRTPRTKIVGCAWVVVIAKP